MEIKYEATPVLVQKEVFTPPASTKASLGWVQITWVLLALGIFFRLFHFLDNRSLWLDELYLVSSLINMDIQQLVFSNLAYEQKAPVGFLLICKLTVVLFGKSEMAFRLFPFLCGVLSLFFFLSVARYFLKPLGVAVAMGILAFAPPLVYHSVEIKQYSTELFATVLSLYLYTRYHKKSAYTSLLSWGVLGAILIWFSFTAVFILAGMAMGVTVYYLLKKQWALMFKMAIPFGMWFVSFGISYVLISAKQTDAAWLLHYFKIRYAFMPFPLASVEDLKWPFQFLGTRLFHYPLGLLWETSTFIQNPVLEHYMRRPLFAIACAILGILLFAKRDKKFIMVLMFPFLLLMVASALELYPVGERLTVFVAPSVILLIALGCERIALFAQRISRVISFILVLIVLAAPLWASASQVIHPQDFGGYRKVYYREALTLLDEKWQKGDQIYFYWNVMTPYRVYKDIHPWQYNVMEGNDFRKSSANASDYLQKVSAELKSIKKSKRVWVFHNKMLSMDIGDFEGRPSWYSKEVLEEQKLQKLFTELGQEVYTYETAELKLSLYEVGGE